MSAHLEENGLYILPHALGETDYVIVRAEQHGDSWRLIENHDAPGGSDRFRARASLGPEHQLVFDVSPSGDIRQSAPRDEQRATYTLANLSMLGYQREGRFSER